MKKRSKQLLCASAWTFLIFQIVLEPHMVRPYIYSYAHISYSFSDPLIDCVNVCSHTVLLFSPRLVSSEPMHGPRRLEVVDIQSKQVTVRWEPLGYNVTRCHNYNLTVQYRSRVGGKEETREELCYDTQSRDPQHTIHNLTPFTNLSVKLVLRNPEGVMESKELQFQTDEDGEWGLCGCGCDFSRCRI